MNNPTEPQGLKTERPQVYRFQHGQWQAQISAERVTDIQSHWSLGHGPKAKHGILLLHGLWATPLGLSTLIEPLSTEGYSVAAPLLPGHGTTPKELDNTTCMQWLEKCEAALQQLQQHCDHISLLGFSIGGALACQLAAQHPECRSLWLLAPAVYPPRLLRCFKIIKPLLRSIGIRALKFQDCNINDQQAACYLYRKSYLNTYQQALDCMRAAEQALPHIKQPTTVFFSLHDQVIPAASVPRLMSTLANQDAELIWLNQSGHLLALDFDHQRIVKCLLEKLPTLMSD